VATNPPQGAFARFLDDVDPDLRSICSALRGLIIELHPAFVEVVWSRQGIASYGIGPKKMSEHYAYIGPQKSYVNLGFYRGAALRDPHGVLEGTGKNLRHVKVKSASSVRSAAVVKLLREAIAEREGRRA